MPPSRLSPSTSVATSLCVFALVYFLTFFNCGLDLDDEGFLLFNASSVLHGQWPMADYFSYQPLSYFLLALFFRLLGEGVLTERIMLMMLILTNVWLVFYCARRVIPLTRAWLPALMYAFAPGPWYKVFFIWHLLLSLAALIYFIGRPNALRAGLTGIVVGLAAVSRVEAAAVAVALTIPFLWVHAWATTVARGNADNEWEWLQPAGHWTLTFVTGLTAVVLAMGGAYWLGGKWPALVANVRHYYSYGDSVSYVNANLGITSSFSPIKLISQPSKEMWAYGLALGICALNVGFIGLQISRSQGRADTALLRRLAVALFGVGSLGYTYYYVWNSRMLSSFPIVYINCMLFLETLHRRIAGTRGAPGTAKMTVAIGLVIMAFFLSWFTRVQNYSGSYKTIVKNGMAQVDHPLLRGVYVYAEQAKSIGDLMRELRNARPGDGLVSMSEATTMSYLAMLPNPTYYRLFTAEFARPGEEDMAIETFDSLRVRYFVARRSQFFPGGGPGSNLAVYAPKIRQYLIDHYEISPLGDGFALLERKESGVTRN